MQPRFVHLCLHTEYSLVDGLVRIKPLAARLAEQKMPAIARTDRSNLFARVKFYRALQGAGAKPVIGAVNGAAVGVGVTMTLPMDIRIASDNARFGFVFARRGIVPEACSSWFLPRLVGISTAAEWCYTGRVFPATEALERGLVRSVHAPCDLLSIAREIAREIADNTAPVSVALTRQMLWRMLGAAHPMEAHRVDSRGIQSRGASADAREGVESFLEKRQPVYPVKVSEGLPDIFVDYVEPDFH